MRGERVAQAVAGWRPSRLRSGGPRGRRPAGPRSCGDAGVRDAASGSLRLIDSGSKTWPRPAFRSRACCSCSRARWACSRGTARAGSRVRQNPGNLGWRQDHGHPNRPLGVNEVVWGVKVTTKNAAIEKEECAQRLVLGGCRHFASDREVREKRLHLGGSRAVVARADGVAQPVEKAWAMAAPLVRGRGDEGSRGHRRFGSSPSPPDKGGEDVQRTNISACNVNDELVWVNVNEPKSRLWS